MTISTLFSAIIQLILFSLVPFICWLLWGRKKEPFLKWLGLKKPIVANKLRFYCFFIVTLILFLVLGLITILYFTNGTELASSEFYGVGYSGIIAVLIYAFIQTGLSEEIVFRGFIVKRISDKFGFAVGNTVQAVLFGCLHGLMFFSSAGILNAIVITLLTGSIGWLMGFMNEKLAGGSIVPSWVMHGLSNLFSAFLMLFSLL